MVLLFEKIAIRRMVECDKSFHLGMARAKLKILQTFHAKRYKRHTKKYKVHRKITGLIGSQCEKIIDKQEEIFSREIFAKQEDVEKFANLISLFKKIRKMWNSRELFSDEHIVELQSNALLFGRMLNLYYPFTVNGNSEYLHYLVDHVGELERHTETFFSVLTGNAIAKWIFRGHVAKGEHHQNLSLSSQVLSRGLKTGSSVVQNNIPPTLTRGKANMFKLPRKR